MAVVPVNVDLIASELFGLADTLKAAIIVSAAALLSRMAEDVDANARSAVFHLNTMRSKLDGVRKNVFEKSGVTLIARLKGRVKEIDTEAFTEIMDVIDLRLASYHDTLFDALENKHRHGMDNFARRVGALGRALQEAIALVSNQKLPLSPLFFDQFFADTLMKLSERDWGPEGP